MTWNPLRGVTASGEVDIPSHTDWHPNFSTVRTRRSSEHASAMRGPAMISRLLQLSMAWLCLLAQTSSAQQTLTARVVDATSRQPIAGATVVGAGAIVHSAPDGSFALPLAPTGGGASVPLSLKAVGFARVETSLRAGDANNVVAMSRLRPKAVYLSVYGVANRTLRDAALGLPGRTAINALVIDVKGDRGMTSYRSLARERIGAQAYAPPRTPRIENFAAWLKSLHAHGIYLIARIVVFKDDPLAQAHPEWAVRDAQGDVWQDREHLRWLDPMLPAVWAHNLDVAEEAARLGFDEIQFDYLRFPDAPGLRFASPNTEPQRVAAITGFLSAANARLAPYNVYTSADIFGYVCWNLNDTMLGQQLETLPPLVDYISPMLYPSGFTWGLPGCRAPIEHPGEIVSRTLAQAVDRTGLPGIRFRPWLQAFRDYAFDRRPFGATEIRAQIDASEAAQTDGWMLWNPRNQYDPATLPRQ